MSPYGFRMRDSDPANERSQSLCPYALEQPHARGPMMIIPQRMCCTRLGYVPVTHKYTLHVYVTHKKYKNGLDTEETPPRPSRPPILHRATLRWTVG